MRPLTALAILSAAFCVAQPPQVVTLPAGTKIATDLLSPIWSKSAQPGDLIRTATTFPLAANNQLAIPVGTYLEGRIEIVYRPDWNATRPELRIHFTRLIFANGYTVTLDPALPTAIADVAVQIEKNSELLLDGGAPIEVVLLRPVALHASSVAAAANLPVPPRTPTRATTVCKSTAANSGTPATVIPGTPAIPPTVVPGAPGQPNTVFPGTPGTDPVVIPGIPPTSRSIRCFEPPRVISQTPLHTETFYLDSEAQISGRFLPKGQYEASWQGLGPLVQVKITKRSLLNRGKSEAGLPANLIVLSSPSSGSEVKLSPTSNGAASLDSINFKGRNFALQLQP